MLKNKFNKKCAEPIRGKKLDTPKRHSKRNEQIF